MSSLPPPSRAADGNAEGCDEGCDGNTLVGDGDEAGGRNVPVEGRRMVEAFDQVTQRVHRALKQSGWAGKRGGMRGEQSARWLNERKQRDVEETGDFPPDLALTS